MLLSENLGNPFLPGIFFLQLSKNLVMPVQQRSAEACLAVELSLFAKGNSFASLAVYLLRSQPLTPIFSIQYRRHLFLTNWDVRMAESIAVYCAGFPKHLNSKTNMVYRHL